MPSGLVPSNRAQQFDKRSPDNSMSYIKDSGSNELKTQYHLLSDVILRLRNNIVITYFDRYLSCFGIKIQIILANLYKLKIEY